LEFIVGSADCDPTAALGRCRPPSTAELTQLLATNDQGVQAVWTFDSSNAISNGVLGAVRDHTPVCITGGAQWQPTWRTGGSSNWGCAWNDASGCDHFRYGNDLNRRCGGSNFATSGWGLDLNDDFGYCLPGFKMGVTNEGGGSGNDFGFFGTGCELRQYYGALYYK